MPSRASMVLPLNEKHQVYEVLIYEVLINETNVK